ncbi:hypothetical protein WKG93_18555 [Pantoea agglomerans]|uniref:hypothetical protein n=1 Tax=Enterobacter agglomerans TaxID=549 RepID=UPI0023B03F76|nr:hypothetical protein [Pantoea agglomerans]WEC75181.1 hypothetical protein LDO72_23330 [Pantoea agglomerans]WNK74225.1 hypothetical protein RM155_23335 [Pantoea agglomerans]
MINSFSDLETSAIKMKNKDVSEELSAAMDYRQQIQSRFHKNLSIDTELLIEACVHIQKVFPGSFDNDEMPLAILRDYFIQNDIKDKMSLNQIEELINEKFNDPDHPLRSMIGNNETAFDDFLSSEVTKSYAQDIEAACQRLEIDLRDGVTIGITHQEIIQAEQQSVFMTDASVINITSNLHMLSHRASKLLAKSIAFDLVEDNKFRISNNLDDYKNLLLNDPQLQRLWESFFADYAYNPQNPPRGEPVYLGALHVQNCFDDMRQAIDLFILSHEFGHHIAKHSSSGEAGTGITSQEQSFFMEHEADVIASDIVLDIGVKEDNFNFFASANLGAFCILKIIEYTKMANGILKGDTETSIANPSSDHPPLVDRLGLIKTYIANYKYEEETAKTICSLIDIFCDLIDFIWHNSSKFIILLKNEGVTPVTTDKTDWLP